MSETDEMESVTASADSILQVQHLGGSEKQRYEQQTWSQMTWESNAVSSAFQLCELREFC